jgi:hypothetical protein
MNPHENLESIVCLGLLITCNFCEKSLLTECIPLGESPMPLSVRNNQRTAWTSNDRKIETDQRVAYVSYVEVNGGTRTHDRIIMRGSIHVIE